MGSESGSVRGRFIVLDGPEGSGKSTQIRRLADHLAFRRIFRIEHHGASADQRVVRAVEDVRDRLEGGLALIGRVPQVLEAVKHHDGCRLRPRHRSSRHHSPPD